MSRVFYAGREPWALGSRSARDCCDGQGLGGGLQCCCTLSKKAKEVGGTENHDFRNSLPRYSPDFALHLLWRLPPCPKRRCRTGGGGAMGIDARSCKSTHFQLFVFLLLLFCFLALETLGLTFAMLNTQGQFSKFKTIIVGLQGLNFKDGT